ncbi:MAG: extracellular solute-binding protein [Firmicutes bacterium]|nr:extracellular solute-binding protein [Bacillota bacterium]
MFTRLPRRPAADAAALDRLLAAGALAPPPAAAGAELQRAAAQAAALARPAPAVGAAAGARVALPLDVDIDVVYVRVGFLPAAPASWSQISGLGRASAPAVAQAGGRLQPGLAVGRDDAALIAGLAAAYGAPPAAAAPAPDAAALDGPAGDAAASQISRWLHDGDLWPAADPVAAFTDGRAGAILAPASAIGPIEAALGGHASFMTGTLPGMPARVRVLALLPYGPPRSRAAAAAFAAFLEEPEPQAVWAAQTGRLPASRKALDTATWRAYAAHHPEVARWAAGLAQATTWPPDGAAAALDAARARLALLFGTGTGGTGGGGR